MPGISFLTQNIKKMLHPPGVDCPPLPLKLYAKPWGLEKILPNSQKFAGFPHQKNWL